MTVPLVYRHRRTLNADQPVELRFVDMLLIIIATLMIVTVVLSVVSAITGSGRPDVAPRVTTRGVPVALAGQPYQLTLAVQGGDGTYRWEKADGVLPAGLTLGADGTVTGTPATEQATAVRVRVRDGSGRVSEPRELAFTVRPSGAAAAKQAKPRILADMTLLDKAVAGQMFQHTFTADAGAAPYRWSAEGLPAGLELAPDGTLAGRPDEAGTSTFTLTMTDDGGAVVQQAIRLTVQEAPKSWFWELLDTLAAIFMWVGTALLALYILWIFKVILFGHKGGVVPVVRGVFGKRQ
ncbi:Ig domain-containing protein [Amycolatopsis suaedae]|uniref:Uncharacterized protein n=1 Tax=Amycolatopsis suaedae TaxID=2510978 RepID=A0A4Q7JBD9_9PSEU|nr:Ig domain-containing protein [Amycolatopsis suaedae]RZQ64398.1 hypothetical protein EWH70_10580 [Amycolatopsis suaedae]